MSRLIFLKIALVVMKIASVVPDVAAVVPDPLPVVMDLVPLLMDFFPFGLGASLVAVTEVAPLEPAVMLKLALVGTERPMVLPQVSVVLLQVSTVFTAIANVLADALAVLQGVAGRLCKTWRRDADRSQCG